MRCTDPRTVGFLPDGKTLSWSQKHYSKEFSTFKLPCGQCLECRLEYARQWAVRCVHEAEMHEDSSFITLTYSDENLESPMLIYEHWQNFMKRLRFKYAERKISVFVTGEYGEKTKRPHWHALLFNWRPDNLYYHRSNDLGDKIYTSPELDELWGKNDRDSCPTEIGAVTFRSAGYCARYATKKLVHGRDQEHEFHPISKKSSKYAIGRSYVEKFHDSIFNLGKIVLPDGNTCAIPRYYEKWLKEHQFEKWKRYVSETKARISSEAQQRAEKIDASERRQNVERSNRDGCRARAVITNNEARAKLAESRLARLHQSLK